MANFAHINKDGIVDQVIVIEQSVIEQAGGWPVNHVFCPISEWKQSDPATGASKGYAHDKAAGVFIPPQPFPSWTVDKTVGEVAKWNPPTALPKDGIRRSWDEQSLSWVEVSVLEQAIIDATLIINDVTPQ